jgi:hypothetical protein
MKTKFLLLRIAGIINILFAAFHLSFYKLFGWSTSLASLSQSDRAIMLTYHCICIMILLFMVFITLFRTKPLLESRLKTDILGFFSLFYIVRIATEFILFGYKASTPMILIICLVPIVLFVIAMLPDKTNKKI